MKRDQNIYFIIIFVCIILCAILIGDDNEKLISTDQGIGILLGLVVGILFSGVYAISYNNLLIKVEKKPDNITPIPN